MSVAAFVSTRYAPEFTVPELSRPRSLLDGGRRYGVPALMAGAAAGPR